MTEHSSPSSPLVLAARNAFISSVNILQDSRSQQAVSVNFDTLYHFLVAYQLLDPTLSHPTVADSASALAAFPPNPLLTSLLAPYRKARSSQKENERCLSKDTTSRSQHSDGTISGGSQQQHAHADNIGNKRSTPNNLWFSTDQMPQEEVGDPEDLEKEERLAVLCNPQRRPLESLRIVPYGRYKYSLHWGNDRCLSCIGAGVMVCKTEYGIPSCKLCQQSNIRCTSLSGYPFNGEKVVEALVLAHLTKVLAPDGSVSLARHTERWLLPTLEQEAFFRQEYFRHGPVSMLPVHLHLPQQPRPRDDDEYQEEEEGEDDSSDDEVEQQRLIRWVKKLRRVSSFHDSKRLTEGVWGADVRDVRYRYNNEKCMRCKQRGNLDCAVRPGIASCAWCKLKKKGCVRPPTANTSRME